MCACVRERERKRERETERERERDKQTERDEEKGFDFARLKPFFRNQLFTNKSCCKKKD